MPEETLAVSVFRFPFFIVNLEALNLIVGDFTVILQVRVTPSALDGNGCRAMFFGSHYSGI